MEAKFDLCYRSLNMLIPILLIYKVKILVQLRT